MEKRLIEAANRKYNDWATQRDNLITLGRNATTIHAKLLQTLYQQCGLQVGTKPST